VSQTSSQSNSESYFSDSEVKAKQKKSITKRTDVESLPAANRSAKPAKQNHVDRIDKPKHKVEQPRKFRYNRRSGMAVKNCSSVVSGRDRAGESVDHVPSEVDSFSVVKVAVANNTRSKRRWDKDCVCVYCKVVVNGKLFHHLERHYLEELEVAEAFSYPKKSAQMKRLLKILANKGYFHHNIAVIQQGTG
jgi:hypothetical protein